MPVIWRDVLKQMKTLDADGNPSINTIAVVKCDRSKKTGGEIVTYENVQVSGLHRKSKSVKHREKFERISQHKDPNHTANATLNLYNPLTRRTNKIHCRLIVKFNGQIVIY